MTPINLVNKVFRYLKKNGIIPTFKKIIRKLVGSNWLPADEDFLFIEKSCEILPHERWSMPAECLPYNGRISVVIPSYNGAHELPELLTALQAQTHIDDLEIVVVDSGSKDGTDLLAEAAGAKVIRIPQEDFSHSYSRMTGAKAATGEYLLFMTQDALPDRLDWIIRMLQPCLVSNAAAVSCYETPKPDADLLSHITVWNWKKVMSGGGDKLTSLPEDTSYNTLRRSAQLSDNACLVKRSIFMELGGHRGAYAEDLDLGIRLLQSGYRLGILSSISVVHSHNRPAVYNFKRAIVDAVNIAKIFDDFRLDALTVTEAFNRLFTAVCANRLFVRSLNRLRDEEFTPEAFTEWIRSQYNQIIIQLRKMTPSELEQLLLEDEDDLDASVRSFIAPLWEMYSQSYHFDGGLAATQARYLMHTVCTYLKESNLNIDQAMREDLSHLIWQYLGQSGGYTVAAAYLNPSVSDARLTETVREYSAGV